jgi:uncharacterized membrane protein YkoI
MKGRLPMPKRVIMSIVIVAAVMAVVGTFTASANGPSTNAAHPKSLLSSVAGLIGLGDDEAQVPPGILDDGKDLLPQATLSLDQAIKAAQGADSGKLGEVDLEHYKGHLVFNVDIGAHDVKVDAANGKVLSADADD